RGRVSTGHGG
ncbi:hypothetical protein A2U01_0075013, partial [Trifolium medium]|nr:hypothetical protein [Trifolium medium]